MAQPKIKTNIEARVKDTGDILTGQLLFDNQDDFSAIRKNRNVNNIEYQACFGVGYLSSGIGSCSFELGNLTNDPTTYASRLDITEDKIIFTDKNRKVYNLIGESYIKTYTSLSQFGCDDSEFNSTNFMDNMRIINDKFTHYVNDSVIINLIFRAAEGKGDVINFPIFFESLINKINTDLGLELSLTSSSISLQYRLSNRYQPSIIEINLEASGYTEKILYCVYNRNSNTDTLSSIKVLVAENSSPVFSSLKIRNTTSNPEKFSRLPLLTAEYQNGVGAYYKNNIIQAIGTANTENAYNGTYMFGSDNGYTIICAGESANTMVPVLDLADKEGICLATDDSIHFYTGISNEATSYTLSQTISKSAINTNVLLNVNNGIVLADGKQIKRIGRSSSWYNGRDAALIRQTSYNGYNAILSCKTTNGSWELGPYTNDILYFVYNTDTGYNSGANTTGQYFNTINLRPNGILYGAAWNDYAEYRKQNEIIPPGYCAVPDDTGRLSKTSYRLQACDGIVSDTFGFAIGETDECQTPLAVAGRVLAYCEGSRYDYHAGDTVGAGPEGKVVKMTREEIKEYPDRIIGHVSEIPEYEFWGTGQVSVDNRIWIKVK